MKFKTSVSLMIAVALGLVTAYVGADYLKKYRSKMGTGTKVVVAVKDMEPGYVVTAADLELKDFPASLVPAKAVRELKVAVGRTIAGTTVKGLPVVESQLAPVGSAAGIASMIPKGMRAVTVDVSDSSSVAGLLMPGCFVDVISTSRAGEQTVTWTVVENVKVQFVQRSKPLYTSRTAITNAGASPELGPAKTVTLLVTPKQAKAIESANSSGKPRLVLRGNSDDTPGGNENVTQKELMGIPDEPPKAVEPIVVEKPVAVDETTFADPPVPETPKRAVEVIKGGVSSTITYDVENQEDGKGATAPAAKKPNSAEARTVSGKAPEEAPRKDEGRGNIRKGT